MLGVTSSCVQATVAAGVADKVEFGLDVAGECTRARESPFYVVTEFACLLKASEFYIDGNYDLDFKTKNAADKAFIPDNTLPTRNAHCANSSRPCTPFNA